MVKIDRKVREVISQIKLAEAEKAIAQNKIRCGASSFSSYLIKATSLKNPIHITGPLALYVNLLYKIITV